MATKLTKLRIAAYSLVLIIALAALVVSSCTREAQAPADSRAAALDWTRHGIMNQDQWTVDVTGAAGSGSGSAEWPGGGMEGRIYAVHLDYTASVSSTTDMTLTVGSPAMTVFVKSDNVTDTWLYPSVQHTGSSGSAVSGAYLAMPATGSLTAQVGQSSTGTLTVTVLWGE